MKPLAAFIASAVVLLAVGHTAFAQDAPAANPVDAKLEAEKAVSMKVLQNVKMLCTGCMMRAADEGERFKIQTGTFKSDISPYLLDKNGFTSPLDKPNYPSYRFNKYLQNVPQNKVKKPAETVMVYEGEWGHPLFRYHGMAVIGFADGHVKMFTPATAKGLLWKP